MGLEGIMLSEMSQTKEGKYHMISLMCSEPTKRINKWTNKTKTNSQKEQIDYWGQMGSGSTWNRWSIQLYGGW